MLHGAYSAIMQDEDGQILEAHSISAGLDYPGTGPQHAHLRDTGRARYEAVTDRQALAAFQPVAELEGIIPALESSHAVAWVLAAPPSRARPDLPLRARRQGPRRGARGAGRGVSTGIERIAAAFAATDGRAALMPYLMGGFPDLEASLAIGEAYADGGADLVELGVPFSDPLADGPVIHAAGTRGARGGRDGAGVIELGARARRAPAGRAHVLREPRPGPRRRALRRRAGASAGVSGLIIPDLPLEEARRALAACDAAGLALVPLVAPTTPEERLARDRRPGPRLHLRGLGDRHDGRARASSTPASCSRACKAHTDVPVALGFGIATPEQAAAAAAAGADGVIVGSRLVRAAAEGEDVRGARGRARGGARRAIAARIRRRMGLVLTTTAGLVLWIVLWAIGVKSFDAFLLTLGMIIWPATARMIAALPSGQSPGPRRPATNRGSPHPRYAGFACAPARTLESRRKSESPL